MGDVPRAGYSVVCIVSPTQLALVRSTGSPSSLVRGFRPRAKSSVQSLVRRGCPDEPRRFVGALIRLAERTHPPHPTHPTDGPCMHLSVAVSAYPAAWSDAIGDPPSMEPTR
jgi:hypothetical protein